jgi:hypothetical protein
MNRYFIIIAFALSYFSPIPRSEALEIHLVDGRVLTAATCWEENGLIKYERYGAAVAIEKQKVLRIDVPNNDKIAEEDNVFKRARKIYADWCKIKIKYNRSINSQPGSNVSSMSDDEIASRLLIGNDFETYEKRIVNMINSGFPDDKIISFLEN